MSGGIVEETKKNNVKDISSAVEDEDDNLKTKSSSSSKNEKKNVTVRTSSSNEEMMNKMNLDEQVAYTRTLELLHVEPTEDESDLDGRDMTTAATNIPLITIPTVVSLRDVVKHTPNPDEPLPTLYSSQMSRSVLEKALKELLDKGTSRSAAAAHHHPEGATTTPMQQLIDFHRSRLIGNAGGNASIDSDSLNTSLSSIDQNQVFDEKFDNTANEIELEQSTVVPITNLVISGPTAPASASAPSFVSAAVCVPVSSPTAATSAAGIDEASSDAMEGTTAANSNNDDDTFQFIKQSFDKYKCTDDALQALTIMGSSIPRRVCQHPFRKNDIVWVCRTCQSDETCVLCHNCYKQSNHDGHDVAFYHAQAGGCCDCGDPDAWDPKGFCPHHGPDAYKNAIAAATSSGENNELMLSPSVISRVRGIIPACGEWLVDVIAKNAIRAHERPKLKKKKKKNKKDDEKQMSSSSLLKHQETMFDTELAPSTSTGRTATTTTGPQQHEEQQQDHQAFSSRQHSLDSSIDAIIRGERRTDSEGDLIDIIAGVGGGDDIGSSNSSSSSSAISDEDDDDEDDVVMDEEEKEADNDNDRDDIMDEALDHMLIDHGHVFLPSAASTSKSRHRHGHHYQGRTTTTKPLVSPRKVKRGKKDPTRNTELSIAQKLGILGREEHGLYLVLHSDDIHTREELSEGFRDLLGSSHTGGTAHHHLHHHHYHNEEHIRDLVNALRTHGQLVVWGTMELVSECSSNLIKLWLDGDIIASGRIGGAMLERAKRLVKHKLICSIYTRKELQCEQRSVGLLQWLTQLARSCDPLCQTVAESLQSNEHLVPMLKADFQLGARVIKAWHSLLLTLLAVPIFKSRLAAAYCDTYRHVTSEYAHGLGVLERSGYTLSVQFLNRVTYVIGLVHGRDLLGKLGKCLLETFSVAIKPPHHHHHHGGFYRYSHKKKKRIKIKLLPRLDPNHFVLTHRRYSPCISDLKCVLNVDGMSRLFASTDIGGTFLNDWISSLSLAQNMDMQIWRTWTQGHVDYEPRGWVGAFNASISLGSLFERLLNWDDDDKSPLDDNKNPLSTSLLSCVDLTFHVLTHGLLKWQKLEMLSHQPTPYYLKNSMARDTAPAHRDILPDVTEPERRCPAALPFSTISAKHGSATAMWALPVSQMTPWSFHLPLHRFVAASLREVCRRRADSDNSNTMEYLLKKLQNELSVKQYDALFRGLMEFPLLVLSRCAQVRAGLWRRNGPGMHDQVHNYAEPPFCRALRDADVLLLQFAILGRTINQRSISTDKSRDIGTVAIEENEDAGANDNTKTVGYSGAKQNSYDVGCSFLVHLLLHRFGLFDFVGFAKATDFYRSRYTDEISAKMYRGEEQPMQGSLSSAATVQGDPPTVLPWTYTPSKDSATSLALLEDFLHMLIILVTELPPDPPRDKTDHTNQAKHRLRREVVHRLASGAKTHSELAEVHHVLSHWDNTFLSEEGKKLNPDDATGAALETALSEVADRKSSRGRLAPDQWELRKAAWDDYDPAFFHSSLRAHQSAAENRPPPPKPSSPPPFGLAPKPYAPQLAPKAHSAFHRIRRDVTADASVLAIVYRTLHVHCRKRGGFHERTDMDELRGRIAYEKDAMSETALARAVHFLTLGAFVWGQDGSGVAKGTNEDSCWKSNGGGSVGSVFYDIPDGGPEPAAREWVEATLLSEPNELLDDEWYDCEEKALSLIRRLAVEGGSSGGFIAQDQAVRAGAAWLCEFAVKHSPNAAKMIGGRSGGAAAVAGGGQSDIMRRKNEAKARAMKKMEELRKKFAATNQLDENDDAGDENKDGNEKDESLEVASVRSLTRSMSQASDHDSEISAKSGASAASPARSESGFSLGSNDDIPSVQFEEDLIPDRLLKNRPQCIICSDEGGGGLSDYIKKEDEGHRKRSRRKGDGNNALGFVGYSQASTVFKGGGGPPPQSDDSSPSSTVRRFVGIHVVLCGHAVHSECCESYLATVSHREDRHSGRRQEFRCPLCQRLSNCLVPFIDVGADWLDTPTCLPVSSDETATGKRKNINDDDAISTEDPATEKRTIPLHDFLQRTPWWISRNDQSVEWNGQCAFIASQQSLSSQASVVDNEKNIEESKPKRRRSVRSLRKRDLYAAWNTMMRTPRFIRKRHRQKRAESQPLPSTSQSPVPPSPPQWPLSEETSGETMVWRKLMDLVSDVALRADGDRLGDEQLLLNFGEFRHYVVEKNAYNVVNRAAGRETIDWPACISPTVLPDGQRQELSREKLLSKLLMSAQALTYSCCSEACEAKRLLRRLRSFSDTEAKALCSKYGIRGATCNGQLLVMPHPSVTEDEGSQAFDGRMGKLRYFGLAVMAAAGAVSADLVQLVLDLPLSLNLSKRESQDSKCSDDSMDIEMDLPRAPVVYPILFGNVLTHVVAALCAACGRTRARCDSLEMAWPLPFSKHGSLHLSAVDGSAVPQTDRNIDELVNDCSGFLKLGLLARLLQVLLGSLGFRPDGQNWPNSAAGKLLLNDIRTSLNVHDGTVETRQALSQEYWRYTCFKLLDVALSTDLGSSSSEALPDTKLETNSIDKFNEACSKALVEGSSYLANAGIMLQILIPGIVARNENVDSVPGENPTNGLAADLERMDNLRVYLGLEPVDVMIKSNLVQSVVANWFKSANHHAKKGGKHDQVIGGSTIYNRLYKSEGFRIEDWPMESASNHVEEFDLATDIDQKPAALPATGMSEPMDGQMQVETLSSFKKNVPLLGGYASGKKDRKIDDGEHPRISTLPTSYTDLYAELGALCPDSEQTGLCLVCGEVLNAGGKGECTKHASKCGAGAGIFFLLQECVGLIMHNGKAAYVHSPYVDSHGETPQYRGRPLNLDLDRYDVLHQMWSGHTVREKVVAERGTSRQVIITDFY